MNIPGFRWDPEKNRYFKILKSGQLPGGEYTIANLAEKDRTLQRKIASERSNDADQPQKLPQNIFEYKKISRKAIDAYHGGEEELITSIFINSKGYLATGSRNGVVSLGRHRSNDGPRSIVDINEIDGKTIFAGVDDRLGSIVTSPKRSMNLPREFATSLCSLEDVLLIGSQRGITTWNLNYREDCNDVFPLGSVNKIARLGEKEQKALVGFKNGEIQLLDLQEEQSVSVTKLSNNRSVTNLDSTSHSQLFVATGLEDGMYMYDLRCGSQSVFEFTEYKNWSTSKHGFALNKTKTAVAVALDTGDVHVWDAMTGASLGTVNYGKIPKIVTPSMAWTEKGLFIASMNSVRLMTGGSGVFEQPLVSRVDKAYLSEAHNTLHSPAAI